MKYNTIIVALLSAILITGFVASSCKSQDVPTTLYKTSSGANITAVTALKAWNEYLKDHKVSVEQELAVQNAYDKYRTAQHGILVFASAVLTNATGVNTNQFDVYVADSSVALNELISLLLKFGVKLQ